MNVMEMTEQARVQAIRIDPRGVLPPRARRKFERLKVERDEFEALASVTRARIERIESTLHALSNADAEAAREELAELRTKATRLDGQRHLWQVDRLAEWASAAMVGMIDAPAVTNPKGATIETVRATVTGLKRDLAQTRAAPLTAEELKAAAAKWVAAKAVEGRPAIDARTGEIMFPQTGVSPLALAAWMEPATIMAALARDIDASTDGRAMTAKDRAAKVRGLEAALSEAERVEEALIEAAGGTIPRRRDADPAAILGVVVGKVAARAA